MLANPAGLVQANPVLLSDKFTRYDSTSLANRLVWSKQQ
jgi:hypothetical protein